jgi:hypothetical protein
MMAVIPVPSTFLQALCDTLSTDALLSASFSRPYLKGVGMVQLLSG